MAEQSARSARSARLGEGRVGAQCQGGAQKLPGQSGLISFVGRLKYRCLSGGSVWEIEERKGNLENREIPLFKSWGLRYFATGFEKKMEQLESVSSFTFG